MEIEQQRLKHNSDKGSLLEVHLYVTSAQSPADLKALNIYLSLDLIGRENSSDWDAIEGIRQRTKHGRPDWDQVKMTTFFYTVYLVCQIFINLLSYLI